MSSNTSGGGISCLAFLFLILITAAAVTWVVATVAKGVLSA